MAKTTIIQNAQIVNQGEQYKASLLIEGDYIQTIDRSCTIDEADELIDASGKFLLPGMIDDQVHFRDPGLTHKGDLYSEAKAAVAGGITSFMEMPNTLPRTLDQDLLEQKYQNASEKSLANYSFYMGSSNDNIEEIRKTNPTQVCGIKIFLGASTGNMLVDNQETIENILKFSAETGLIVTTHCEDEDILQANIAKFKQEYGDNVDISHHPLIRSHEACYKSSSAIIKLARKHNAQLHILHLTTADEIALLDDKPLGEKNITAEVCVHHLWFSEEDYKSKGSFIKWNPSIKGIKDRDALRQALNSGHIDIIATDHAPHTLEEKSETNYFKCPAGGPLVQHALVAALELSSQGVFSLETVIDKYAHAPAIRFKVKNRGFIKEGYFADLVLVDMNSPWTVDRASLLYKCGWSPFEGQEFKSKVLNTWVNGNLIYDNGKFNEDHKGQRLEFDRQDTTLSTLSGKDKSLSL